MKVIRSCFALYIDTKKVFVALLEGKIFPEVLKEGVLNEGILKQGITVSKVLKSESNG